jgi:hypothetical protein
MKRIAFLLLATGFIVQGRSQLVVNLQLPPIALTLKNQLWNMALINNGGILHIKADITITDQANNVLVLTGSSAEFTLATGTRQMQAADFMPLAYNVSNANYGIDNNPNGFLPAGRFTICYQFSKITGDNIEVIAEECEAIEIDPLSPPLLIFPENGAMLETNRPVFNWLPPAPFSLFGNLSYDLRLVEVGLTQVADDAIQQNIAVYAQQNIYNPVTVYPAGLPALDTGKLYAWQVIVKSNNSFIAKSDTWEFRIGHFGSIGEQYNTGEPFAKLKANGSTNYFLCTGTLRFYYDNYLNDDTVKLNIYEVNDMQKTIQLENNFLILGAGQNLKQIDIQAIQGIRRDQIYLLELINSRREKWIARFLFKEAVKSVTDIHTN